MKAKNSNSYWEDEHGNFSILFGIVLFVILLAGSLALNTQQLHDKKQRLNAAADTAVLAAVKAVSDEIALIETGNWRKVGQDIGFSLFEENIQQITGIGDVKFDLQLDVAAGNRNVIGKLIYSTSASTFLSAIMGRDDVTISDEAEAQKTLFKFARINFMIDVSGSMGIGADDANQSRLANETGCAIACHGNQNHPNTLLPAREQNIRLRIDTVKDAITQMVTLLEESGAKLEFEIGLYTFSNSVIEHLAPTTNFTHVKNAIHDIELSGEPSQGGTNIQYSLEQLSDIISAGGDGKRARSRESFVVVLTDGVENSYRTYFPAPAAASDRDPNFTVFSPFVTIGNQVNQGFNPESCDTIKRQNHTLAFLNPTYLIPIQGDIKPSQADKFNFIENTLIADIIENSQFCSSRTGYAFSAETEAEVERAAFDLFDDLLGKSVRLSK